MKYIAFKCSYAGGNKHRRHVMSRQHVVCTCTYNTGVVQVYKIKCSRCMARHNYTGECSADYPEVVEKCKYHKKVKK